MEQEQRQDAGSATVWPIALAIGIVVLLVGLVVNTEVIAPLGGAIALLAALGWARQTERPERPPAAPAAAPVARETAERFPRNRLLERSVLALGGLVAVIAAAPAIGVATLSGFSEGRRKPVDLGPLGTRIRRASSSSRRSCPTRRRARSRAVPLTSATTGLPAAYRASRSCPAAARTSAARPSRTGRCSGSGIR